MKLLRVFKDEDLKRSSRQNLELKLAMVETSEDLTREEKELNIKKIRFYLNGQVHHTSKEVLDNIAAGAADTDDIVGKKLRIG